MGATGKKIKGKLKEIEGRVTGDKVREVEGAIENTVGKIGTSIKAGARRAKLNAAKVAAKTKIGRKAAAAKAMP